MSQSSPRQSSASSLDRTGPGVGQENPADEPGGGDRSASWPAAVFDPTAWFPGLYPAGSGGAPLDQDDLLRCREQALLAASYMAPELTAFIEEDAENVVTLAKRFEKYLRDGQ